MTKYHRVTADSDKKLSFYAFYGEFRVKCNENSDNPLTKTLYTQLHGNNEVYSKTINCSISPHKYKRLNSRSNLSYELFSPDHRLFLIQVDTVNKIINFVDNKLSQNDNYNVNKLKCIMNIKDSSQYKHIKAGRIHIYNLSLMTYYDGKNWNKFTLEEIENA